MARKRTGKNLTTVHKRQTLHVNEDGTTEHKPITLYLDGTGETPMFVYLIPDYVSLALGVPDQVAEITAEKALRAYREILEKYVEHVKTAKAEPVILVSYSYDAKTADGHTLSNDRTVYHGRERADQRRSIGISYRLAFKVNGKIYSAKERYFEIEAKWPGGDKYMKKDMSRPPEIVPGALEPYTDAADAMPYTPELHAKLDRIVAAIDQAAQVLHDLDRAKDRGAALLALGSGPLLAGPRPSNPDDGATIPPTEHS